jgi:flavin-dependent thymidylate synthase
METKKPVVTLQGVPDYILERIYVAKKVQSEEVSADYEEIRRTVPKEELERMFRTLIKDKLSPFFRWISMDWRLENVSRSLQQQLTRHTLGFSYSIQSLRVVDVGMFATEGAYHIPATVKNKEKYRAAMTIIQNLYREMVDEGETVQDARGILPLNIHSTVSMTCNLQAFIDMVNKRLCLKTQGEFQHVGLLMIEECKKKLPAVVCEAFGEPCRFGPCIMIPENEMQIKEGKFESGANTSHVCPLYLKLGLSEAHPEWKRVQDWKDSVHARGQLTEDEVMK